MDADPVRIARLADDFAEIAREAMLDQATAFGCTEAYVNLLVAIGRPYDAQAFIAVHARGDEEDDLHWRIRQELENH